VSANKGFRAADPGIMYVVYLKRLSEATSTIRQLAFVNRPFSFIHHLLPAVFPAFCI
jgi:hypothetical protein